MNGHRCGGHRCAGEGCASGGEWASPPVNRWWQTGPMQLVILTRAFPYPPGEQFIAPEAVHWPGPDRRVVVMPWTASGDPVAVPEGVEVDLTLARASANQRRLAAAKAVVTPELWRDLGWLLRRRRLTRGTLVEVLQATRNAVLARDLLRGWARRHGPIDVVYGYWYGPWTLGALMAKGRADHRDHRDRRGPRRRSPIRAVVTRVHGYDLHESRHPAGFHALKRQLSRRLDALLPVSVSGGQVAVDDFGVAAEQVQHSPLGVELPAVRSVTSGQHELALVSVASALPVKRIDLMVEAATLFAEQHPDWRVHWTHLGGGEQLDTLRARAADAPPNLTITWAGQVSPAQVREHYLTQPVDLFVNTSSSEGVPVSIMEAMAHGVPVLAPRVGALDEIVPDNGLGGELLPADPSPAQVAAAIATWATRAKSPAQRAAAHKIVADGYDANANAARVMQQLDALADQGFEGRHG